MARWTTMTFDEFKSRFYLGAEHARVSWVATIARFTHLLVLTCAVRVVMHAMEHRLDRREAVDTLELTMVGLTVLVLATAILVHRQSPELRGVASWAKTGALGAALVLLVCLPRM
jgi:hypothetical protein